MGDRISDRMDVESPSHYGHGQHYSPQQNHYPNTPPPPSQNQQSNPFYQINQAFIQQQQQGFNQFSQNKNYQPGYSQNQGGMNSGYGGYPNPNPNQSFPNNNQYPPHQYPPNAYQQQGPPVPGTPPYPNNGSPNFNPLDFLRKWCSCYIINIYHHVE